MCVCSVLHYVLFCCSFLCCAILVLYGLLLRWMVKGRRTLCRCNISPCASVMLQARRYECKQFDENVDMRAMNWTIAWFNCYRLSYKKHKANQFEYKCRRHHMDIDQTNCITETAKITKLMIFFCNWGKINGK